MSTAEKRAAYLLSASCASDTIDPALQARCIAIKEQTDADDATEPATDKCDICAELSSNVKVLQDPDAPIYPSDLQALRDYCAHKNKCSVEAKPKWTPMADRQHVYETEILGKGNKQ